jgi:hypothetical protein
MTFHHDAGVFRPNGVSRRNFDGLKTPNPSSFGHWVCLGKKVVGKNPNGVSAKCAIDGPHPALSLALGSGRGGWRRWVGTAQGRRGRTKTGYVLGGLGPGQQRDEAFRTTRRLPTGMR